MFHSFQICNEATVWPSLGNCFARISGHCRWIQLQQSKSRALRFGSIIWKAQALAEVRKNRLYSGSVEMCLQGFTCTTPLSLVCFGWAVCIYIHLLVLPLFCSSVVAHKVALTTNASRAVGERSCAWWDAPGSVDGAALPYCCVGDRVDVRFPMGFVSGVKTCVKCVT